MKTRQATKELEERFLTIFEQAAVGIAHVSPDTHFVKINQKFCDIVDKFLHFTIKFIMLFFLKTDRRHMGSCEARKFLLIILLVMTLLPVLLAQTKEMDTPEDPIINLSAEERAWLQEKHTVHVAVGNFPPFEIVDDKVRGLTIDYLDKIFKRHGIRYEYVTDKEISWSESLESIKNHGIVDMLGGIRATAERQQYMVFSQEWVSLPWGIFSRTDSPPIQGLEDLKGKTIAVEKDYLIHSLLKQDYPEIDLHVISGTNLTERCLFALATGKVDAYVGNLVEGSYQVLNKGFGNLKVAAPTPYKTQNHSMGIRDDWPELAGIINKTLSAMPQQEHTAMREKWLSVQFEEGMQWSSGPQPNPRIQLVNLDLEEQAWLKEHPVIRVASLADWVPMSSVDEDGNFTGLSIDYLRNIEEKLGVRFEFVQYQSGLQMLAAARERVIDMISCYEESTERSEVLSFSSPYFTTPTSIFSRMEVPYIGDLSGLAGKKVSLIRGSVHYKNLTRDHPEISLVGVSSVDEGLNMLDSDSVFAFVGGLFAVSDHISQHGHALVKVVGETPYRNSLGLASRKDWPVFTSILQKALDSINEEERNSIRRKWLSVTYEHGFDYSLVWKILAVVTAVLAMFFYWNRRLTREITKRKKAEDALQESNLLLSSILDSPDNVLMLALDSNSNYLSYNKTHLRAMKKVYGVDIEIGKNLLSYISNEDDHLQIKSNHIRVLKGERFSQIQEFGHFEDRTWFELLFNPIIGISNKITGFTVFGIEITERKKAEEALRRYAEEVQAANQAKSMFLSNMSHELRTPLNAILGFAQLMTRDVTIAKEQQEKINIISRSGKHLLSLINEILDFAKIESGRETLDLRSFNLSVFLKEIEELFQSRMIEKGLFFALEKDDDLPQYIKSDEGKLRQVLINLIGNAIKFTERGSVTLRVRTGALAENVQRLLFEVEDTGIGIDSDQLENIFDPFVQVGHIRAGSQGTGLGLAICKSFMELLKGEINVESTLGEGSLFRIELEVDLAEAAEEVGIEAPRPDVLGLESGQSMWRILVVEDNADSRLLLNSLLLNVGLDTQQAENGEEAVELFKQWQPHFIWMDMRMPVMDGYQATAKIRSLPGGDTVKIVAITASAFGEQRSSIMEAGCDEVVHKPFQAHEIFETMGEQLGVRYIYEEEIDKKLSSAEKVIDIELAKEMADSLPKQLFDELQQSSMALDMEETYKVLERITEIQPELAGVLRMCLEELDFSAIRRILNHE